MISKDEEEAIYFFLFWKVGPSCDHKTPLKCVLYTFARPYTGGFNFSNIFEKKL